MTEIVNKGKKLSFLHITDCHLSKSESVESVDRKIMVAGMPHALRADLLRNTLHDLATEMKSQDKVLDAVIFSGDATLRGNPDGQIMLRDILLSELAVVGISSKNIIATPGNHDVVARSNPGSLDRYVPFREAWADKDPVIVPFLDGIDNSKKLNFSSHVLKDPQNNWAIFPINSSNWSQVSLPDDENQELAKLRAHLKAKGESDFSKTLERLCTYDVARISDEQLKALRELVEQAGDVKIRIAVIHHHLLPADGREEFKAFADITNLGKLRQVLRALKFHVVVHGHKHVTAAYYDHIYADNSELQSAHRILTVSGGTFGPSGAHPDSPLRLIDITEIPHAPVCKIVSYNSASAGRDLNRSESHDYRLWEGDPIPSGPIVIYGTSIDDVYARALQTVMQEKSEDRTMICTVDFQGDSAIPFPQTYPYQGSPEERREWFEETVKWWQLPASRIEARIPYIHGSRLKRFGGGLDQIKRVISLIKEGKQTSKAIALVVDPVRDFVMDDRPFASFCFVQFCLRSDRRLDCIGYYRVQEFNYWWPVNVAELRYLQLEIAMQASVLPGKITTICPYPRLSQNIRQPTKVAVPLIDQWVDNHPVRIAKIALALGNVNDVSNKDGLLFWKRCLDDLAQAATSYHSDGVQVSIEGLELLHDWLEAASGPPQIAKLVRELLQANENHQATKNTKDDFDRWKKCVDQKINELRILTSLT